MHPGHMLHIVPGVGRHGLIGILRSRLDNACREHRRSHRKYTQNSASHLKRSPDSNNTRQFCFVGLAPQGNANSSGRRVR
jgi:hypothetical protein